MYELYLPPSSLSPLLHVENNNPVVNLSLNVVRRGCKCSRRMRTFQYKKGTKQRQRQLLNSWLLRILSCLCLVPFLISRALYSVGHFAIPIPFSLCYAFTIRKQLEFEFVLHCRSVVVELEVEVKRTRRISKKRNLDILNLIGNTWIKQSVTVTCSFFVAADFIQIHLSAILSFNSVLRGCGINLSL